MDNTNETMDMFYEHILHVSTLHKQDPVAVPIEPTNDDEKHILASHTDEMVNIICENYRDNIRAAAERGDTKAIICLYQEGAKYRKIINIHKLLYPHSALFDKYNTYEITILEERLQEIFHPFQVAVKTLSEIFKNNDIDSSWYAIVVEWAL